MLELLLEFIGTFSMLAFVSACLLEYFVLPCSFCLEFALLVLEFAPSRHHWGALSARGSSLKAASLATMPVVRVLCRQKSLRAVRSPPRRLNVEGPISLCLPFNPPGPAVLDRP